MVNEIPFSSLGFAYLRVDIKPRYSATMETLTYKVDTGASCTTISGERLYDLGFDEDWIKTGKLLTGYERPTLASGAVVEDCYEIVLPEIQIGGWVGYNWPFLTSLSVPFRLLLGTDSLQFFNWKLVYERNVCQFELRPGKRRLLFNQQEQSIHAME